MLSFTSRMTALINLRKYYVIKMWEILIVIGVFKPFKVIIERFENFWRLKFNQDFSRGDNIG